MGYQCAVQIKVLVRGDGMRKDGNGKTRHKANAAAIVNEAFEIEDPTDGHAIPIRKSASETYDKTRTKYNKYIGPRTANGVMRILEDEADSYKIEVHTTDKETGEPVIRYRGIQSNTPIGIAVIYHPPCAVARDWTPEQREKFIKDCEEVMAQIPCVKMDKKGKVKKNKDGTPVEEPRYLFQQEHMVARAEHWDEGERENPDEFSVHWHEIFDAKDQYGKYNASMIDALFLSVMVNRMFPQMMRERGWDIDDPERTDWGKFNDDIDYRAERKTKIKKGGKSVNNFRADKKLEKAEAALEEAGAMVEQAASIMEDVTRREQEADEKVRAAEAAQREAEEKKEKAETEKEEAVTQKDEAIKDRDEAFQKQQIILMGNDLLEATRTTIQQDITDLMEERDTIREQLTAAEQERDKTRKETEAAVQKRNAAQAEAASANVAAVEARKELKTTRTQVQSETETLTAKLETTRKEIAAAEQARDAVKEEMKAIKANLATAKTQAQTEITAYRQDLMDRAREEAKEAAKTEQARIEAAARAAWAAWMEDKKRRIEEKANKYIQDAKDKAADILESATGEHDFLIRWLEKLTVKTGPNAGMNYLEIARTIHRKEIRERRLAGHSQTTKDVVAKDKQQSTGKGLGE